MRLFLALAAVLLALAGSAEARMHAPYRGHRILPGTAVEPPLDSLTAPSGAYSFRKLKTTYAGPLVRIRRASDNAEIDINFLGFVPGLGAPWDEAAANAHCALTTCFGRWWYDQSGAALHMGQATAGSQPQLIFDCNGALPCFRFTATGMKLDTVSVTPVSPISLNAVSKRTAGTAANNGLISVGLPPANRIVTALGPTNFVTLAGISGAASRAAAEGAWHSVIGVVQGAGSTLNIDGGEQTSSIAVQTGAGIATVSGVTGNTLDQSEAIFWNGYALTLEDRTVLTANQRSFWGTP